MMACLVFLGLPMANSFIFYFSISSFLLWNNDFVHVFRVFLLKMMVIAIISSVRCALLLIIKRSINKSCFLKVQGQDVLSPLFQRMKL